MRGHRFGRRRGVSTPSTEETLTVLEAVDSQLARRRSTRLGRLLSRAKKRQIVFIVAIALVISLITLAYAAFVSERRGGLADTPTNWTIVVVAGQSNAEGTSSFVSSIPPQQALGTHPADNESYIWWEGADGAAPSDASEFMQAITNPSYNPAGWIRSQNPNPAMQRLVKIRDQDKPLPVGQRHGQFGPEVGLVRELYDQGKRNIIVLKVSYGFQTLAKANSQFVPYDWYPDLPGQPSRNKSYARLKSNYADLTNFLASRGDTYKTGGIFWVQGETDSLSTSWTNSYEANLDLLVNRMKVDLNLDPRGKIVTRKYNFRKCLDNAYPAVGNYCGFGYALDLENATYATILSALTINPIQSIPLNASRVRTIRQAFQTIADRYDWVETVETDDLPMADDFVHFTAEGQLGLGKRMAQMFKMP